MAYDVFRRYILLNMPPEVEELDLSRSAFRVGEWVVQPSLNRLTRGDTTIQLELKVMDVLVCLAGRAGEVVSRRELTDTVWATEFISDNTVSHAVAELRAALGDDAKQPRYIETIHRRGYRLIAAVETEVPEEAGPSKVARFPSIREPAQSEGERSPYPGLAAFTEEDAEYFFGREAEVARMWRKLTSRRLLAVIGPSGVGKSSFLRAGVIPAKPEGWGAIVCQPGEGPFGSLARALVPEFAGDIEATAHLVDLREADRAVAVVSRWRGRFQQALLVVDQFEELFTQNAAEEQRRFAGLLRTLADDADVHVVLAMRDDFLYRCQGLEPLHPVFDGLLPLEQPDSESLRRALVEPARRQGYAFEDDELPREMVAEVEGERGALPMLAFAVARLWEKRDRELRLLTRRSYAEIGKVGGALAKHAEATLTALGDAKLPIVRELFRNLVTAEGTRAVREWDELLSVFRDSSDESKAAVLRQLIDARLLTSYEVREENREPTRRVEIIHESLLATWPRLQRWQTQDADAAQLRDQLRQAARTWDEHGRTTDYLWTGKAYREYALWRESYAGWLSELEEAFASAMTSLATRRRRRRRIAAAAAVATALVVAAVFATLWRRSVQETRRAEASKLLALAHLQLATDPTEALAYATASLQLADTGDARIFAMKAMWTAPPALVLDGLGQSGTFPQFSPDGRWLAVAGHAEDVLVFHESGGDPIRLPGHTIGLGSNVAAWASEQYLVTGHASDLAVVVWSIPEGRQLRKIDFRAPAFFQVEGTRLSAFAHPGDRPRPSSLIAGGAIRGPELLEPWEILRWELPEGDAENLGWFDFSAVGATDCVFDRAGNGLIYVKENTLRLRPLSDRDGVNDREIGDHEHNADILPLRWEEPDRVWSKDASTGELRCWSTSAPRGAGPLNVLTPGPELTGSRFAVRDVSREWRLPVESHDSKAPWLWDRSLLQASKPFKLSANAYWYMSFTDIHPAGTWLVASAGHWDRVYFWPLVKALPSVVEGYRHNYKPVAFSPDGGRLITSWSDGLPRVWPLRSGEKEHGVAPTWQGLLANVTFDPDGRFVLTIGTGSTLSMVPLDGGPPRNLEGFSDNHLIATAAFSPSGHQVAAATGYGTVEPKVLRVWDLGSGDVQVFDLEPPGDAVQKTGAAMTGYEHGVGINGLGFMNESTLYGASTDGVMRWNLDTGEAEVVAAADPGGGGGGVFTSTDRRTMLVYPSPSGRRVPAGVAAVVHDLTEDTSTEIDLALAPGCRCLDVDPGADILVQGCDDGSIRVGRMSEPQRHFLMGHEGTVERVEISPEGTLIASTGTDETLRLWPMPDLSKPPLHTLPHDELIAKLHSLTNLRAVRDAESSTGWKIEVGPFPGWATVPEW